MTNLTFDPAQGEAFWAAVRQLPGYPEGESQPIRAMVFERGALYRLPELLALAGAQPSQPLLVVMDETVMRREGVALKPQVLDLLRANGWQPEPIWLQPDSTGQVHTDFAHIEAVQARLRPGVGVLSVGSGTVTDVAKHACFGWAQENHAAPLPFVVYQTANSVSAYTSNMAPVFVDGVKRTLPSRYPDVLVCDLETVRDAPASMTAAGVGDLVAGLSSFADWYLAQQLGLDDTHTELARTLMGPLDDLLWAEAPAIRAGDLEATAVLAKLITLAGLAMSLSHATAPLSGYEHVISHVLDLMAEKAGRPLAQHGTQVALATLLTTRAWTIFLDEFDPAEVNLAQCYPEAALMEARIQETFARLDPEGRVAGECWADYGMKLAAWHRQCNQTAAAFENWPAVRAGLQARLRSWERAADILERAGATLRFEALDPPASEAEVRFAFFAAPLIRRRLTLGDLFILMQWETDDLWRRVWNGNAPPAPRSA